MILCYLEYYLGLTLLVLQIWDIGCVDLAYIIIAPSEVTAQAGLCVHIPCQFTVRNPLTVNTSANGFWYRPYSAQELVAWNKDSPRRRMFFTGEVSNRDCSLFINDVQTNDNNTYQFRLEDVIKYNYYNIRPRLKVTGLTDKPEISVGKLVAGKEATVTCKSPGTCAGSAPAITWSGKDGSSLNYFNSYPNDTSSYFSNITFTPSKEDNNLPLVCNVIFLQNTATTEQSINLNVEYPPDVIITIRDPVPKYSPPRTGPPGSPAGATSEDFTFPVVEGDTKMINCTVDSNPIAKITWFVGDDVKEGPTDGPTLIYWLDNISLSDAGKYLCLGKNDHGTSNRTIYIIVHYPPRTPNIICPTTKDCTIDDQHMIYIKEESTFSLLCTAESLPEASLSWKTSGPSNNQTEVNGHLTLYYLSISDEGKFTCIASNNYGKSMSSVNIKVTYKPKTVTGKNSSCWEHESHIECVCVIQSFPTADIEWNIDGKLYSSNHSDKELYIFTMTINAVTNSTLTLKSSRTDIKSIQCMSSNKHGRLDQLLLEYTKSGYNIEIISAISCIVVIVVLFIGGFLAMHHFRKKRLAQKPEDKKEINGDNCSVVHTNSEEDIYGNQQTEIGTNSVCTVQDSSDASLYMNLEDVQYATIHFSKLKPKIASENIEVEYAEIKK
ncbi:sialic acid-binding Ig-like lectin 16 [Rhinoderma darwinii]|uniref:sialic acid-binding Ig-like lectin 16 n=1 Tax=Rhinoderma darwinii TaxID=43563 RepID=UPI003F67ACBF